MVIREYPWQKTTKTKLAEFGFRQFGGENEILAAQALRGDELCSFSSPLSLTDKTKLVEFGFVGLAERTRFELVVG